MLNVQAIGSPGMGGAERFLARLAGSLAARGHPTIAVLRRGAELCDQLDPAVEIVETGMVNGADVRTCWAIRRLIVARKPAIIQTWLGRASRLTRVPRRSPTVHIARLGGYYRPNAYRHADVWVGNTLGICDHLVRLGFPTERIHHITNFVEPVAGAAERIGQTPRRAETGVPEDALLVFALGRFVEKKGFVDLLAAFEQLPERIAGHPVHLAIAGDGPLRPQLEKLARAPALAGRIHLPGWLAAPGPWFLAADIFVCPSRDEPLGNVVLEAWSHALPVIATRTAGPLELVTDEGDGILVDIGDARGIATVLRRLLESREERDRLARAGLDTVRQRHSPDTVVDAYLDLYRRATRRPR